MCTDWTCQQKKKILHKLCIDMERSEYTSFSMLAILKCEFQWTSILILRYMDSRGWGKAGRHSVTVSSFSTSAIRSVWLYYYSGVCSINTNLTNTSKEDPEYIHHQRHTAEYILCHGFEPASQCAPASQLYGIAGKCLSAYPEHGDACKQRAERNDIDGDGIHPRA